MTSFSKTLKIASENPGKRAKFLPLLWRQASAGVLAQRRFLVAAARVQPELRPDLIRKLQAARGVVALEHATDAARKKYLKDHPGADPSNHTVKKETESGGESGSSAPEGGAVGKKNLGKGAKPSQVHGNAVVHGEATIHDNAEVGGHAVVYGKATIEGNAKIGQDAEVFDQALISDDAEVSGSAQISGKTTILENAKISGDAKISGTSSVLGKARITGKAEIKSSVIEDSAQIGGTAKVMNASIEGKATLIGGTWDGENVKFGQWKDPKGFAQVKKFSLQSGDVQQVLDKVVNPKGRKLSPAELMRKFLQEAKPETRERMKGMSPAEFMDLVKFMASDEEVDAAMGGKTASQKAAAKAKKPTPKLKGKKLSNLVDTYFYKHGRNTQFSIWDLGKMAKEAEAAYNAAETHEEGEAALEEAMKKAVVKYKVASASRVARFPSGKSVDVAKWLRDNGHEQAAADWEKYDGKVEELSKSASNATKPDLSDAKIRSAAIRVAYNSKDPDLRRQIVRAIKACDEMACDECGADCSHGDEGDLMARFEEGKPADPTVNMSPEDKKKWETYDGKVEELSKSAALSPARIKELAAKKDVKKIAVENFLGSLNDMFHEDAVRNFKRDAKSYKWNAATQKAISTGISEFYK